MLQGLGAGRGDIQVVLAHPQVDPERAQYLGLVVDYEDSDSRGGTPRPPRTGGFAPRSPPAVCSGRQAGPRIRHFRGHRPTPPLATSRPAPCTAGTSAVAAGPGAAGSERAMVSPPPGVSSGSRVPPIASVRPRESARPSPTPVVLSVSPNRWNGTKILSRSSSGMPGPRSTMRSSTRPASALAVSSGGDPSGED